MKISTSVLDKISYIYLAIPLFIFLLFWLKPVLAVITVIFLFFSLKGILVKNKKPDYLFGVSKNTFILIFVIAALWCIFAGIGGLLYQSPDWHVRNAIFRDLVNFSFPVQYDNGSMLVYYMGLFLPGSLFAKVFLFLGSETAFKLGNYFTLFYVIIGINLIFLQIIRITKLTKKQQLLVVLMFIFFSGLDIFEPDLKSNFFTLHLERHYSFQYSSNTTLLFWVYNQAVMPWLITLLFLRNPYKPEKFGILGTLCLFYSPLTFCGIFAYFSIISLIYLIKLFKKKKYIVFFKKIFSKENLYILPIALIVYFYFKSNETVDSEGFIFVFSDYAAKNILNFYTSLGDLFFFVLMEAGVFFIPIYYKFKNNILYLLTIFQLIFIPFFKFSDCADFCMRASIPALLVLFVFVCKYLFNKNNKVIKIFLVMMLLLGSITPGVEFLRSFVHNLLAERYTLVKDNVKTYNNKIYKENCHYETITGSGVLTVGTNYCNYGAIEPERYFFFKYLANIKNTKM